MSQSQILDSIKDRNNPKTWGENSDPVCQKCGKATKDIFISIVNGEVEYQLCRQCFHER